MKAKTLKALFILLLFGISMIAVTGCHNDASKAKSKLEKELVKNAEEQVKEWLSANISNAVLQKDSLRSYSNDTNLYDAVIGEYKVDDRNYRFVYSLNQKKIYIDDERVEEASETLHENMLKDFLPGYPEDTFRFKLKNAGFLYRISSVNYGPFDSEENKELTSEITYGGIPYGVSVDDLLRKTDDEYDYTVEFYDEIIFDDLDTLEGKLAFSDDEEDAEGALIRVPALISRKYGYTIHLYNRLCSEMITLVCFKNKNDGKLEVTRWTLNADKTDFTENDKTWYIVDYANRTLTEEKR